MVVPTSNVDCFKLASTVRSYQDLIHFAYPRGVGILGIFELNGIEFN